MCWMIVDSKLLFDQPSDPRGSPDLSTKAVMLGSFRQQERQLRPVFSRQFRLSAMWNNTTQGVSALSLCFLDPLTYSSFGHPKCFGDVFLFPALLIQLPGTQAASFAPIFGKEGKFAHTFWDRLL